MSRQALSIAETGVCTMNFDVDMEAMDLDDDKDEMRI